MKSSEYSVRLIAYYLPQFHPIPENDVWWGKGFTEWTNVAKARPFFKRHYQPHLPGELGFYDLRVPETREEHASLARQYGIHGFCYWHYWFHGKRLLERPVNEVLASGRPDFPFCLAWANESWSRNWDGWDHHILMEQQYSPQDDLNHARWLAEAFADPRYIRVDGRPLFGVYRANRLPEPRRTLDVLRNECVRLGIPEPYIFGRDTHCRCMDMRQYGCDITEHAAPDLGVLPDCFVPGWSLARVRRNLSHGIMSRWKRIYRYADAVDAMLAVKLNHPYMPSGFVGWDTTPRRGPDAIVLTDTTPEVFERYLRTLIKSVDDKPPEHQIVFINAWNEWAEGMHLEPDQKHGRAFLEAVATARRMVVAQNT